MSDPTRVGGPLPVYKVEKVCTQKGCGARWVGNSFTAPAENEPPRMGTCDRCLDDIEARKKGLLVTQRRVEPVQAELLPPQEVGDAWEEPGVLPFRRPK